MIVRGVAVGSPAEQAGLAAGDTLVELGGMPPTFERFQALRMTLRPGDALELTVRNGQKPRTLVVRAAPRPSDMDLAVTVQVNGLPDGWMTPYLIGQDRVAGARVAMLNAGLAQYFGTERGLLVIEVAPGTPAAAARLLPGDVLLSVGGVAVDELPSLRRVVAAAGPDRALRVIVIRRGREVEISLPR
jgi:serine protease Do